MKIAITALGKNINAQLSDKPGTALHLLVMDMLSKEFPCPTGHNKA